MGAIYWPPSIVGWFEGLPVYQPVGSLMIEKWGSLRIFPKNLSDLFLSFGSHRIYQYLTRQLPTPLGRREWLVDVCLFFGFFSHAPV